MGDWFGKVFSGGDDPEAGFLGRLMDWAVANPDKAVATTLGLISAPFLAWVFLRKNFFSKPTPSKPTITSRTRRARVPSPNANPLWFLA